MTRVLWRDRSPVWRTGLVAMVLVGAGLAWWLGSPLFIRTTLDEAVPTLAPATAAAATPGTTAAATAAGATSAGAATAPPTAAGPVVIAEGELQYVDELHNGRGPVRILDLGGPRILRFENVAITNAPDIHVYLSPDTGGKWSESTSLYLGILKATNGSFNYDIPASADLSMYKSVVVWCRAFAVLVTYADLRSP